MARWAGWSVQSSAPDASKMWRVRCTSTALGMRKLTACQVQALLPSRGFRGLCFVLCGLFKPCASTNLWFQACIDASCTTTLLARAAQVLDPGSKDLTGETEPLQVNVAMLKVCQYLIAGVRGHVCQRRTRCQSWAFMSVLKEKWTALLLGCECISML